MPTPRSRRVRCKRSSGEKAVETGKQHPRRRQRHRHFEPSTTAFCRRGASIRRWRRQCSKGQCHAGSAGSPRRGTARGMGMFHRGCQHGPRPPLAAIAATSNRTPDGSPTDSPTCAATASRSWKPSRCQASPTASGAPRHRLNIAQRVDPLADGAHPARTSISRRCPGIADPRRREAPGEDARSHWDQRFAIAGQGVEGCKSVHQGLGLGL